jgi:phosphate transport system protein
MERHFEHELENLKENLIAMGNLVENQLDASYRSLFEGKVDLANAVIEGDLRVNEYDTNIDSQCQRLFALNQPVAIDLRLLMSALNMNRDLERIGDIAVNIAERVRPLVNYSAFLRSTRLPEMAQIAQIMVKDSLEAFITSNPSLATRVLESDDVVDGLDRNIFYRLVREMEDQHVPIEPAAHILILSRHIERLADHATNIAEDVIFLVDAKMVKHNAFEGDR